METSTPVIAWTSRLVTRIVDRLTGSREDFPLLVGQGVVEALKLHSISARILYGNAAWIEVLEDGSIAWAGCRGESLHFWVDTEFGELVDLNVVRAHRVKSASSGVKGLYSAPMLWSKEIPGFYRYKIHGIAEADPTQERDANWLRTLREELVRHRSEFSAALPPEFADEPILINGRKLLDDAQGSFKHFDRAIAVLGLPPAPTL